MRRSKFRPPQPRPLPSIRGVTGVNQAYGAGLSAARIGTATNPHPPGTEKYDAWHAGYRAGKRGRMKGL